jgi:hypothetical protein
MSETARIDSIAELRAFRVALVKFADACNVALGDAEADMQRTLQWLERDQVSYWNNQLAKRAETVSRCKEAVRMKKLFKSPTGSQQSAVEEEKALRIAIRNYEEAEQKIVACKQWSKRLQKEIMMYKGGVTRFTSVLGGDIPRALGALDAMATSLEQYAALSAGGGGGGAAAAATTGGYGADSGLPSMSRAPDEMGQGGAGPGVLDIAALRANVPPPEVRAAAPETDIREENWELPALSTDARKAVVELKQPVTPVESGQTLVMAKGAWSAPRIYLERRAATSPTDTGWYIASTDTTGIVALNKVLVRDLLEIRPDFRELLTLPEGYLAVVDRDGVRSVFTPVGEDLASRKPAAEGGETTATA